MTRRLRLLFLSYFSPPAGGPGAQRPEMLLRYLPPEVDAVVITAALEDYTAMSPLRMPLDASRFPKEDGLFRVPAGCPYWLFRTLPKLRLYGAIKWLYVPDVARSWAPRAVALAETLHRQQPFDVVFSTAPPFSVALAGRDCARRLRIPWVCDLQDLWTGYLLGAWPSRWHYRHEAALEETIAAEATTTVMLTPSSREWMLRNHPSLDPERVECVTNGYDPADFPAESGAVERTFTIVHTGAFCGSLEPEGKLRRAVQGRAFQVRRGDRSAHSPAVLVRAMELLADRRVEFRHIGPMDSVNQRLFENSSVRDQIRAVGYLDHRDTLAELMRADAAYLCLATALGETRNELVPQKTFEYLASRKPILAPIQEGDATDYVRDAGTGICTAPGDFQALASVLKELVEAKFAHRTLVFPREELIRRFEWTCLAGKLVQIIDRVASARTVSCSVA